MTLPCVVIPYTAADGPVNMALDEAMLAAAAGTGRAVLRFYGWSVPTLSLGYFQRFAEASADPRWADVSIVRRPTGGGAIWHHHELTYAIAVPPASPLVRPNTALYRAVHASIADVIRQHGLPVQRAGDHLDATRDAGNRPLLCFVGRDEEDLVCEGKKLVGSAQRRRGGAVLQHGSITLARSPVTPELVGICDFADVPRSASYWIERFSKSLIEDLDLRVVSTGLTAAISEHARELERTRYRDPAWTQSR